MYMRPNLDELLNRRRITSMFGQPEPQTFEGSYNPPLWNDDPAELPLNAAKSPSYLDQFRESLAARPTREEPTMKRKIFAGIGGGLASLGDEGARAGQRVTQGIMEGPYLRKMQDWQSKTGDLARLADIEGRESDRSYTRDVTERKLRVDEGQLDVQRQGVDTARRTADSNIKLDEAQIARIENEMKTGNTQFLGEANGSFHFFDKTTGKTTSYVTGGMTDQQKATAQQRLMQMQIDAGRFQGGDGSLSPNQQSDAIALALNKLLKDPDALRKYGKFIDQTDPANPKIDPTKVGHVDRPWYQGDITADQNTPEYKADKALYDELRRAVGLMPATGGGGTNIPTDRVKVKDPNGKEGTIPKSQLQAALAQGYKEVK